MRYFQLSAVVLFLIGCDAFLIESSLSGRSSYENYCTAQEHNYPRNCLDLLCGGYTSDGVYDVYPTGNQHFKISVYCDQTTSGGGWTTFQRRMDGSVDFYRNWQNYRNGFGEVRGEHWLGLENMRSILSTSSFNQLRVDLENFENERRFAEYSNFAISNETSGYQLRVSGYSGDAGDSLGGTSSFVSHGMKFTTKDRDQDTITQNCAVVYKGAWWYRDCHRSNLNGKYLSGKTTSFADGVAWHSWTGYHYSLKTTEMKIRPYLE